MIVVLAPFAPLFSDRVWRHAQVLVLGALLVPGKRTVSRCLRVMGLAWDAHFTNYHRVLNRAAWSALQASQILLGLLVCVVVPPDCGPPACEAAALRNSSERSGAANSVRPPAARLQKSPASAASL